ncbi:MULTISPECIES: glycosyltransferase family 2 protein [unclassified Cyanobium]|uniref:glycosyltransferase family 2 protein n=1 Tax=unclassified Cyanobium TaxID=2627006 RepID=UPI0020CEB602|nr:MULTISPECIES: glycosyltransferase [unclassified Cyanobium]MCP9835792.1 glycosyltransferase [Cyanobium sp. La Preciosa 7G6]MCP9938558.1 glycosyltransferase [Cyanobium sp. Aljojuca 7A6]
MNAPVRSSAVRSGDIGAAEPVSSGHSSPGGSPTSPLVTVVVVFRERHSFASRSLRSILENRDYPFALHYHDSQSPPSVRRELEAAQARGELSLFTAGPGTPNQQRNQALQAVTTKYVCFIDNDVLVTRGWIETLVATAERTGAGIVFPLYLMGELSEDRIHMAGGKNHLSEKDGQIEYNEEHLFANAPASRVAGSLQGGDSDFGEFHCMLLSMKMLQDVGPLDEAYLQVNEHIDIAMVARQANYRVIFEPKSVVSYVYANEHSPYWLCDIEPFRSRWSHEQAARDVAYLSSKWKLRSLQSMTFFLNRQIGSMELVQPRPGTGAAALGQAVDNHAYPYVHSFPLLVRQCLEHGHSPQEIASLNRVFDVAAELHGGSFRGSKKTFQEHVVRTASVLVAHGAPFDLVKASLLHAVYMPTTSRRHLAPTERNRALLRELVGRKVEAIAHAYGAASAAAPADHQGPPPVIEELPIVCAQASVVRIANDIEDLLDHAALLERKSLKHFARVHAAHGPVAETCGYQAMVAEFAERIRLAEVALAPGSQDPAAAAWLIELLRERSPHPLLQSHSLAVRSRRLAARVVRKLPRQGIPLPLKLAARKALSPFGLV